jgi:hypothetical protein
MYIPNLCVYILTTRYKPQDIVELPIEENMDNGKTHAAFIWAHQQLPNADYIGKSDLDTYLNFPLLLTLIPFPDRVNTRLTGRSSEGRKKEVEKRGFYLGQSHCYAASADHPKCAEGGFYLLSSSLVRWIALNESLCANRRHPSCPAAAAFTVREGRSAEDLVTCKQINRAENDGGIAVERRLWTAPMFHPFWVHRVKVSQGGTTASLCCTITF